MKLAKQYIKDVLPTISEENIKLLLEDVEYKKYKKGSILFKEGEIPKYFYFIKQGIVRSYHTTNGKEVIDTLYISPEVCGSTIPLFQQTPLNITCECITNCEVLKFNYTEFKKKASDNIELSALNTVILEKISIRLAKRINALTLLDATDRYLKLKEDFPNIEKLVKQYHIASFLNITPVQLSRIRKKLATK